jgi:hypothetical protein
VGVVDDLGGFTVDIGPFGGLALVIREQEDEDEE